MTELSSFRQLQPFGEYAPSRHAMAGNGLANWVRSTIRQRDLIVIAGFCAIGLALTFAALAQVPDFSAAIGEISLTP